MNDAEVDSHLLEVGLRPGDAVRFRKPDETRFLPGRVTGRNADGSIALTDARGRARAIPIDRIQVAERGPRGGRVWTALADVVARTEQLGLFSDDG